MKMMVAVYAAGILTAFFSSGMVYAQDKEPNVVSTPEGQAPSDAVVLFNGKNLSEWITPDGKPAAWDVSGGAMIVKKGSGGGIMTKKEFGDMQLHIEFATPNPPKGEGQDRGNSGVYLQGIYELQVLDSFGNKTYIDGMAGAIYKEYPPLVNPSRPSGQWQTYDVIFHAPKFDSAKKITQKARVTILFNGVLVQDNVEIVATPGGPRTVEAPRGPIFLQDHNHPVKFRNVWVREL